MSLTSEDKLRLNVMLANKPRAIRIDESRMIVYGLTDNSDIKIQLHPNCRDEQYIKQVKEMLSGEIMNSPGGYPVFIQRWTRMGQMNDESLAELLLLGEPEAVVAVVHAPGLTDKLAERAWWAMEDADNARKMLTNLAVVQGSMGPVLADYLVEYLPFETEAEKMMQSISLVLQPGLVSEEVRASLWKKAKRKTAYYIGFLLTIPDELPETGKPHALGEKFQSELQDLSEKGNKLASLLKRVFSPVGQSWLLTMEKVFDKAVNQDVINEALDVIAQYFSFARQDGTVDATIEELIGESRDCVQGATDEVAEILHLSDEFVDYLCAIRCLSGAGYGVVRPVFCDTTAIGSLMRRKLEPVIQPLRDQMNVLRN